MPGAGGLGRLAVVDSFTSFLQLVLVISSAFFVAVRAFVAFLLSAVSAPHAADRNPKLAWFMNYDVLRVKNNLALPRPWAGPGNCCIAAK